MKMDSYNSILAFGKMPLMLLLLSLLLLAGCGSNDDENGDDTSNGSKGRVSSSSGEGTVNPNSSSSTNGGYPKLVEGQPGVQRGWNSRYWDGCRPHCTLPENAWKDKSYRPEDENPPPEAFDIIAKVCNKDNNEVPAYFWYDEWRKWFSNNSSCEENGPIDGEKLYTCWDMAPYAVNDTLAYGFAATPGTGDQCGKCFQMQFTGEWEDAEARPTHKALKGKTMIVMSSNIGHDVSGGQFDVMIPGGGVGAFNSFSDQLGMNAEDIGARMGGLLSSCEQNELNGGWEASLEQWQTCLRNRCNAVFGDKHENLLNGCLWQVDWYMAANNPVVLYKEVECPQYLIDKYRVSVK